MKKNYLDIRLTLLRKFLFLGIMLSSVGLLGQSISGNVSSEDGPLPGATVVVKGTENGTSTDFDGNFTINASDGDVLIVSFIGFETQEVEVSGDQVDIVLAEGNELDEVVVTGYGTQLRRNITGAVADIDSEVIENRNLTSLGQALAGTTPGVQITQGGGEAGRDEIFINIRGVGTLNNSNPLIIVDGIEGSLNNLNPNDIESISVLKDAASSAIYGSRAANGVIVVKTKRGGKNQKLQFTYDSSFSSTQPTIHTAKNELSYDVLENVNWKNAVDVGNGANGRWTPEQINFINANKANWLGQNGQTPVDIVYQDGSIQQHTFAAQGGTEKTNFRVSLGILDQTDIVRDNTNFKRANFRINLDTEVNEKLSMGTTISMVRGDKTSDGVLDKTGLNSPLFRAARIHNIFSPVYDSQGRLAIATSALANYGVGPGTGLINPETWNNFGNYQRIENNVLANAYIAFSPVENLTLKGTGAVNYLGTSRYAFENNPQNFYYENDGSFFARPTRTSTRENIEFYTETYFATADYKNTFGDLKFEGLIGYQQEENRTTNFTGSRDGFLSDSVQVIDAGASTNQQASGGETGFSVQSVFARFNFDYKNKYLFEANVRADGSSRFKNDKWGTFPSFSAGWILSEEDFLSDSVFDFVKLRASWGQLGNANIGNFEFAQKLSLSESYNFGSAGSNQGFIAPGVGQSTLGNADLGWETNTTTNIGFNAILKNGLRVDFDYFKRVTEDILFDLPVNVLTGFTSQTANAASMENSGFELGLGYNKTFGDLKVQLSGQISTVKNRVTELNPNVGAETDRIINGSRILAEGEVYNAFYMIKSNGVITGSVPATHASLGSQQGDLEFENFDGDGDIDLDDRQIVGKDVPGYTYGFNIFLDYKNWDLGAIFQGAGDYQYVADLEFWGPDFGGVVVWKRWLTESWSPSNPDGTFPRAGNTTPSYTYKSTFFMYDNDFLRLKNLNIGYNIPSDKLPIDGLRIFFNATNLLTWTKLPLIDPEGKSGRQFEIANGPGQQEAAGRAAAAYPQLKTFAIGLSAKF